MLSLVQKSYTGNNLNYLLDFKDQLIWLSHKYIVLNKLLDMSPPRNSDAKRNFKGSVDKTSKEAALHGEHAHYLDALRRRMRQLGI